MGWGAALLSNPSAPGRTSRLQRSVHCPLQHRFLFICSGAFSSSLVTQLSLWSSSWASSTRGPAERAARDRECSLPGPPGALLAPSALRGCRCDSDAVAAMNVPKGTPPQGGSQMLMGDGRDTEPEPDPSSGHALHPELPGSTPRAPRALLCSKGISSLLIPEGICFY